MSKVTTTILNEALMTKKAAAKYFGPYQQIQKILEPKSDVVKDVEDESQTGEKGMNKSQAARAAIDAGYSKPGEAVDYIKSEFGVDINRQHFSAIKSNYLKAQDEAKSTAAKGKPGRKPKSASSRSVEGYLAPSPKHRNADGKADLIESLEVLKPLIAHYGADQLKRLVDLLG